MLTKTATALVAAIMLVGCASGPQADSSASSDDEPVDEDESRRLDEWVSRVLARARAAQGGEIATGGGLTAPD